MSVLDAIDWKIAEVLESDGRRSFAELSDDVGLSKSPCWARVKEMERSGLLIGYGAQFDPARLGLGVLSQISVTIRFDAYTAFEEAVLDHPAIVECHTTAGSSDYLLRVYARSVDHLDELLRHEISKLPGVTSSSTTICLKTIKTKGSLTRWAGQNQ
ncbi:MAG: Lrp/AsnC family transcriptional regulator [Erythrobacter sp.]